MTFFSLLAWHHADVAFWHHDIIWIHANVVAWPQPHLTLGNTIVFFGISATFEHVQTFPNPAWSFSKSTEISLWNTNEFKVLIHESLSSSCMKLDYLDAICGCTRQLKDPKIKKLCSRHNLTSWEKKPSIGTLSRIRNDRSIWSQAHTYLQGSPSPHIICGKLHEVHVIEVQNIKIVSTDKLSGHPKLMTWSQS